MKKNYRLAESCVNCKHMVTICDIPILGIDINACCAGTTEAEVRSVFDRNVQDEMKERFPETDITVHDEFNNSLVYEHIATEALAKQRENVRVSKLLYTCDEFEPAN